MDADLDLFKVDQWLAEHLPNHEPLTSIQKFPGGQSNPTYRLTAPNGNYVLRRKPFGDLLPSAHAVDREYRVLVALYPEQFPVPRPIGLCQDRSVIGAEFYVMDLVAGRTFWQGTLPGLKREERRQVYEAMILTLARLHNIDAATIGLGDFGRPGNYFARQVDRWTRQYRAAQTEEIPDIERLIEWLPKTTPPQTRSSIIHGDYRIDNLIYVPDKQHIAAVIDWELATIGDPLADFAYLMMNWVMPVDSRAGLEGLDFADAGIPTMEEAITLYCEVTNRDDLPDLRWYFAYNLFRLTGIVQGVKKRMLDGNASSEKAHESVAQLLPLARAAWEQARLAGA